MRIQRVRPQKRRVSAPISNSAFPSFDLFNFCPGRHQWLWFSTHVVNTWLWSSTHPVSQGRVGASRAASEPGDFAASLLKPCMQLFLRYRVDREAAHPCRWPQMANLGPAGWTCYVRGGILSFSPEGLQLCSHLWNEKHQVNKWEGFKHAYLEVNSAAHAWGSVESWKSCCELICAIMSASSLFTSWCVR